MQGIGIGCNACACGDYVSLKPLATGKNFTVQVSCNGGAHAHWFLEASTKVFAAGEFRSRVDFVKGRECGEKFVFEGVVGVRVVSDVEGCGWDGGCGCNNEQFGFTKEFVGGVSDFASVRVFGLEEVVEHVIPASGGLFAVGLLRVFVATIVKGASYFEFAALDYTSLDEAVEFLDVVRGNEVEKAVNAARFEPDP